MSNKTKFCNFKNVICLNNDNEYSKMLRDINQVMKKKQINIIKPYSFYDIKDNIEHQFNIKFQVVDNTLEVIISDADGWNDTIQCLNMTFSKPNDKFTMFEKSKINALNKGKCGKKISSGKKILSGKYILRLANKLNDILNVSISELNDDSKIVIDKTEYPNMSLKIIELIKYGKTWYERIGDFVLDDKELYDIAKIVQEQTLSNNIDYVKNNENRDIGEFKLNEENLKKLDIILEKLNVGRNIKMKNLYLKAFSNDSPLSLNEQSELYYYTMLLPSRKRISDDEKSYSKQYNLYNKLSNLHSHFTPSSRIKK